jgi:hypothetical protein
MKQLISLLPFSRRFNYETLPKVEVKDFEQFTFKSKIDHFNYQDDSEFELRAWKNTKYFD